MEPGFHPHLEREHHEHFDKHHHSLREYEYGVMHGEFGHMAHDAIEGGNQKKEA